MFRFANPLWLILLIIPFGAFLSYFIRRGRSDASVRFPNLAVFAEIGDGGGMYKRVITLFIIMEAVTLLILAMARPQTGETLYQRTDHGVDIMLALDVSSSMDALDFDPLTRIEAARQVVREFIEHRRSDRIGLVVFSAQSYTMSPLTLDYDMLSSFLDRLDKARIEDGTAIGSAIASAVNRLRDSDAKSKVVILLTDGMNNRGNIDPLTAARIAQTLGIRVYTIGVGSEGRAPVRVNGRLYYTETHIDEETLREVARITGGNYYRAVDTEELRGIYSDIDRLETSRVTYNEWIDYNEQYPIVLKAGFVLLVIGFLLDNTLFRRIP